MSACVLIRHGATDMAGRFCGHSDPPLNNVGRIQVERASSTLHGVPEVIYSSDLLRARQAAAILSAHFAVPVQVRPGLREIGFGQWEGLLWREIERRFPVESQAWMEQFPAGVIPDGERYDVFRKRVRQEIEFLSAEAESQALIAVTHGGFMRTALHDVYGISADQAHQLSGEYAAIFDLSQLDVGAQRNAST
jgi:alpha-ribazole phosphatase/probable phosphoglycerate mutase